MATTATDPLSLLPTELRLKLYGFVLPPRPLLQIGRQWLSSSIVPNADSWGNFRGSGLGQRYWKDDSDHWPPYIEDAYLEGRCFT